MSPKSFRVDRTSHKIPKLHRARCELCVWLLAVLILPACRSNQTASPTGERLTWTKNWNRNNRVWRGVHFAVQNDEQASALEMALPKLASTGVNVVIAEVDYGFEFRSHPEVRAQQYLSKIKAGELTRAARAQGIRLIPQLNCLGHQSWSKTTLPLLKQHPEFDETPGQYPENEGIYCRSWCPQHPGINTFIFDLIDEMSEAFEADAFHVGMDEVFIIGSSFCPRCRNQAPAGLFAKALNDLHQHIVGQRKLEMLMWSDRFLNASATGFSEWEAAKNGTDPAIDLVPKDIILCDWHYEKREAYPSIPIFVSKGFRVWPSGWQPLEASVAFSRFAARQHDPRVLGYLCTTWGKVKIAEAPDWPPLVEPLKAWK